ncbi:DUF2125 domain-containing protein [uncultured Roseobacter sp.]|uniref:DUF2125 domain-containing protein n=1 Tax=uncultured Roseobacter sp. TaxID=114847 RepID=UPI00260AA447|nr:DUF2125 domain-containing protein [uncultured Roseobacter sp.]
MTFFTLRTASVALIVGAMASAAQADVSGQDVWNDWKTYFKGIGYDVSADESQSGDTLTVSDIEFTSPETSDAAAVTVSIDRMTFTEAGDGTVEVVFPEVMPLEMSTVDQGGAKLDIQMEIRPSGANTTVSGMPTQMTSAYTAQSVELLLTELIVDGETIDAANVAMRVIMNGLSGTTQSSVTGKRLYDQRMQATDVDYTLAFISPEGQDTVDLAGGIDGISFSGESAVPLVVQDASDVSALLAAGMAVKGAFNYSGGSTTMSVKENNAEAFSAETSSTGGKLEVVMGADGLNYSGGQNNLKLAMTTEDFPVPIEVDMARASFNFAMPLQKSDAADDFAVGFSFNDFTMSDLLWGLFDPKAQLPRTPATFVLDLTGKARLLFDFLDPSAAAAVDDPDFTPAELESVDINRLQVTAAGAELTGEGAFTFDTDTPGAGLKPKGSADLMLVGGNKLLDTLVSIGLLPEDQAMGARMMMGLLAVPGTAPDTLNSKIEINEQGHIMANGQRIQ